MVRDIKFHKKPYSGPLNEEDAPPPERTVSEFYVNTDEPEKAEIIHIYQNPNFSSPYSSPERLIHDISHESIHRSTYKALEGEWPKTESGFGSKTEELAHRGLDAAEQKLRGRGPSGIPGSWIEKMENCTNCGDQSQHAHGRHGCCGRQGCHMKLSLAHLAYGEDNVNRLMRRNWPSLKGLI